MQENSTCVNVRLKQKLRKAALSSKIDNIVNYMENYPYSRSFAPSKDPLFSVPTQTLPHVSESASSSSQFCEVPSWPVLVPFEGAAEDRAASASKSHSQAEKRRRDRINAQLATLRKLIPKSDRVSTKHYYDY